MKKFNESVLDFPNEGLDPNVWIKNDDFYTLRPECREKIINIIDFIIRKFKIPQCQVNIIGSITSNSYTKDSDIDLHFNSPKAIKNKVEALTKAIRKEFENYKLQHAESDWHLGEHPIEVYFQGNIFQDMMSVGCYSVLNDTWIVGPELVKSNFNPYNEYYNEDMKYVNNLISIVRDIILKIYEKSLIFGKLSKKEQDKSDLLKLLNKAAKLFAKIRGIRLSFSEPRSKKEALKKRKNRLWKISDSAFKLLDKFGYLAILREYTKCSEEKVNSLEASERVIQVVRQNLGPENKKLHEDEFTEVQEGFGGNCGIWTLKEAKKYLANGKIVQIVFCTNVPYEDRKELLNEGDLYHVALLIDKQLYDASGKISVKYLKDFCNEEYRNPEPEIWALEYRATNEPEDLWIEKVIRNCTAWENESEEQLDEGIMKNIGVAALAAFLAIPGIASVKDTTKAIQSAKTYEQANANLNKIAAKDMVGKYTKYQAANIIARTLFAEAQNQSREGMKAVADTIYNRAGGDKNKLVDICLQHAYSSKAKKDVYQYSCWMKTDMTKMQPDNYQIKIPNGAKTNKKMWNYSLELAVTLVIDKYTAGSSRNSYYNPDKCSPKWGKLMSDVKIIGDHKFGYLPEHDGFKKGKSAKTSTVKQAQEKIHVVKKGQSLSKIAKIYKTTVKKIVDKNNIKDLNKIKIGQKLKI